MLNNIKYSYFEEWDYEDKVARWPLSFEEALDKFNNYEFVIIVANREDKPFATIEISNKDAYYLSYLDSNFNQIRDYKYQILDNLDKKKLFLVEFIAREFKHNDSELTAAFQYDFAYSNLVEGNFEWYILDKVACSETDYIKNEDIEFDSNQKVDLKSLWEDIPEFGNWDHFVRYDLDRVKFIEDK